MNKTTEVIRYIRFHHSDGSIQGNGGITIKFVICHDEKLLEIYPSCCTFEDTFNKEIGQALCNLRHKHDIGIAIEYDPEMTLIENFDYLFELIAGSGEKFDWKQSSIRKLAAKYFVSYRFTYLQPKGERKEIRRVLKQMMKMFREQS